MAMVARFLVFLFALEVVSVLGEPENLDDTSYIDALLSGVTQLLNSSKSVRLSNFDTTNTNLSYNASFQEGHLLLPVLLRSPSFEISGNASQGYNVSARLYVPAVEVNSSCIITTTNESYSGPIYLNIQDINLHAYFEVSSESGNYSLSSLEVSTSDIVGSLDFSIDFAYNVTTAIIEDISETISNYAANNVTSALASLVAANLRKTLEQVKIQNYIIPGEPENLDGTSYIDAVLSGVTQLLNSSKSVRLSNFDTSNTNISYNASFQEGHLLLPVLLRSPSFEISGNSSQGYNVSARLYVPDVEVNSSCTITTTNESYSGSIDLNIQDINLHAYFEVSSKTRNYSLSSLQVSASDIVGSLDFSIYFAYNVTTAIIEDISETISNYATNNVTSALASLVAANLRKTLEHVKIQNYIY